MLLRSMALRRGMTMGIWLYSSSTPEEPPQSPRQLLQLRQRATHKAQMRAHCGSLDYALIDFGL